MAQDDGWYPGMLAAQDQYNPEEGAFQYGIRQTPWHQEFTAREGEPNLDDPNYDYRAAWAAGARPDTRDPGDGQYHWPSQFKGPNHPNRYVNGEDTITGEKVDPGESWDPKDEYPYGPAVQKGMQQMEDQFGHFAKPAPETTPLPAPGAMGSLLNPGYQPSSILDPDKPQEVRSYTPSSRENLAQRLRGDDPSPGRRDVAKLVTGSSGLGGGIGALDFLPGGGLLDAQDEARKGNYQGAAVALMPGGKAVGKAGKGAKPILGEVADMSRYAEPSTPGMGHNIPPTGSKNPLDNVDVTFRGKEPKDFSPDDWQAFGEHYGIKNIGPLSPLQVYKDVNGKEFHLPGGTEGKWSYVDLLHMKANPINPANVDRATHAEMQRKLGRTMTPEQLSDSDVWNGLIFGMTSPNNPLFPNQATASRMRLRDPQMLDDLASSIPWKVGETPTKQQRKLANDEIAARYGLNKGAEGGLGTRGTADYTRVAEMAQKFKEDPSFFRKRDDESWTQAVERISSQLPGLSMKTGSFGTVWQDPAHAAISAIDRHMARELDKVGGIFHSPAERTEWEKRAVELWNNREAKRVVNEEKKNMKDGVARTVTPADVADDFDHLQTKSGADGFMGEMLLSHVGKALTPKFRTAKGEINPNIPKHLREADWVQEPEKVFKVGRAYRQALDVNQRLADENGLNLFMSQWMEWDRIRNRFEPHENMFPGLSNAPAMSVRQMREVDAAHRQTGHKTYGKNPEGTLKPTRTLKGSPSRMGYLGIGGLLGGGGLLPWPGDNAQAEEVQ